MTDQPREMKPTLVLGERARPAAGWSNGLRHAGCRCESALAPVSRHSTGRTARPGPVLQGVQSAYVSHHWDAIPGAATTVGSFAPPAVASGVLRLVLLSGRGEAEAERVEQAVRDSGAELTVLRSIWFAQNFSETYWLDDVLSGEVALPASDTPEPFVDADDIADFAAAAFTEEGHEGEV